MDMGENGSHQIADMLLDFADYVVHVELNRFPAHLVALESSRLPLRRLNERAHGRVPEAIDHPVSRRRGPTQLAIGSKLGAEVEDLVFRHRAFRRHREHGDVTEVGIALGDFRFFNQSGIRVVNGEHFNRSRVHLRTRQIHVDLTASGDRRL